jgi:hypothetical protein
VHVCACGCMYLVGVDTACECKGRVDVWLLCGCGLSASCLCMMVVTSGDFWGLLRALLGAFGVTPWHVLSTAHAQHNTCYHFTTRAAGCRAHE